MAAIIVAFSASTTAHHNDGGNSITNRRDFVTLAPIAAAHFEDVLKVAVIALTSAAVADLPDQVPVVLRAVVSKAVMDVVQTVYIERAVDLQQTLALHKELGAVRVPKRAAQSCLNQIGQTSSVCAVQ